MADRGKRSPDEIARAKAVAAQVMEKQKKVDGLSNIKNGRISIFVVAALLFLGFIVEYSKYPDVLIILVYSPFVLLFLLLGFYYYRNPFVISIIALSVYVTLILILAFADPATIVSGIIVKFLIIGALSSAIRYGKLYNDEFKKKEKSNDDVLDEALLD